MHYLEIIKASCIISKKKKNPCIDFYENKLNTLYQILYFQKNVSYALLKDIDSELHWFGEVPKRYTSNIFRQSWRSQDLKDTG